jgi:GAF domain-containing protein
MQPATSFANLQKLLSLLDPSLNLKEMLTQMAQQVVEVFGVDHSGVLQFGENDLVGEVIAEYPAQNALGLTVPLKNYPLFNRLKAERKPIAVLDAQNDPLMGVVKRTMRTLGIRSILIIPLVVRHKLVGSLSLDVTRALRQFSPDEIELAHVIGNQIAVAIDYTHALDAIEENHRQAQILQEVNQALGETLNLDEILPLILEQLEKVLPVDGSSIYLLMENIVQLKARRGGYSTFRDQQIIPLDRLWGAAEIIKIRRPLLVGDVQNHPHWNQYEGSPLKSWLGAPLIANGEVVGILNMDGYTPHRFKESHIPLALSFANRSAMAIYNARLYGQAKKRADLLASVQEIGFRLISSLDLEQILQAVITSVLDLLEAGQARIYLYDSETHAFTLAAILDNAGQLKMKLSQPRKNGLTASVAQSGQPIAVPDIFGHPLYRNESGIHGFRAIISMPLKQRDTVLGVLNVFYPQPHYFSEEEVDALELLATQTAIAVENARLHLVEQSRRQEQTKRAEQWRRAQEISSSLNASLDLSEILHNACKQFVQLIEVDHCGIILLEGDLTGRLAAEYPATGVLDIPIPIDYPLFKQMLVDHQPFTSFKVSEEAGFGLAHPTLKKLGIQSILIAPLLVHGQVIGSIGLDAIARPHYFDEEEITMIRVMTDQIATAVANARAYQAERSARIQADTLREVAGVLSETLDLGQVLERILAQLERVITYNTASIILRDQERLRLMATRGFPENSDIDGLTFGLAEKSHFREIVQSRRPLVISDTGQFADWSQDGPFAVGSWLGAPLLVSEQLLGILAMAHPDPGFYNQNHAEMITAYAALAALALENARLYEFEVKQIEQELNIARQIQRGFLPERLPDHPGWAIAAICQPARETGGDFYEFIQRNDGLLGVVIGDVSGKSITAAMLMADAHSIVRAKGSDHRSPAKVMAETNRLLYDDVPSGNFVALSYALLSASSSEVTLSSGGQVAPFLVPANGNPLRLIETPGDRLPLGVLPEVNYAEMTLSLAAGDLLIFHTDGLVEQHNSAGRMFGFEGMAAILETLRGQSPETVLQALLQQGQRFADGFGPHDDITLVIVQRTAEES